MSKIQIDEAVLRQALEALEEATPHLPVHTDWRFEAAATALRQALADAALDKMADNARELGIGLTADGKFFCDGKSCKQPAPAQPDALAGFYEWWHNEGSQAPKPTDDMYEHCKRMCEIAWANGAYKALQQPAPAQPLKGKQ